MVISKIGENIAINVIKKFQPLSIYELAKRMSISYSSGYRLFKELKRKDLIIVERRPMKVATNLIRIKEEKENEE